jgi:hypothetical protein
VKRLLYKPLAQLTACGMVHQVGLRVQRFICSLYRHSGELCNHLNTWIKVLHGTVVLTR